MTDVAEDPGTAGTADAGTVDAGTADAGTVDAGTVDAGTVDAGTVDADLSGLIELAGQVRRLVRACIDTSAPTETLAEVARAAGVLAARLEAGARRSTIRIDRTGVGGGVRHLHSPVTGEANPIAPPLSVHRCPDGTVRAEFTLSAAYEGPPGAVHGGVSAAILDTLVSAAAAAGGRPAMTAQLSVRYLRLTPVNTPLTGTAEISRVRGGVLAATGRIIDAHGHTTVAATGQFLTPGRTSGPPLTEPDGGSAGPPTS